MEITISSKKRQENIDITKQAKYFIEKSKIENGVLLVFTPHASAALIINENYDPAVQKDILKLNFQIH